jgi:ATP-binding protein involved in chromosome partitioning
MAIVEELVVQALKQVAYPGFSRDVLAAGVVREIQVEGGTVRLRLALDGAAPRLAADLERSIRQAVGAVPDVAAVELVAAAPAADPSLNVVNNPTKPATQAPAQAETGLLPQVQEVIAVASGKGGVGKSTVAVNLAVALARRGKKVGLLDADIYGPSIPLMFGARDERPRIDHQVERVVPLERFGVRFMSLGFLVDPEAAVIWRGPMVMKALEQLLQDVDWGKLDVLVVDLPPGTGDAQLTLSQRVRLSGAVIVTTPQDVALADAIKGVNMFRKVSVPVMGIVENMSFFQCPHCAERTDVFGHGGGRAQAEKMGVPFLAEIPLEPSIRSSGDEGRPVAATQETAATAEIFLRLADTVAASLQRQEV